MDRVYDFNWIAQEVNYSIVIELFEGEKQIGTYQVFEIQSSDMEKVEIRFANVNDLDNFLNYAVIKFYDTNNGLNILDIPIRNLKKLYENSSILGEEKVTKKINFSDVANFKCFVGKDDSEKNSIGTGRFDEVGDKYYIRAICFGEVSDDLKKIMDIASKYQTMDMQEKFDALASLNLTNYRVEKGNGSKYSA